MAPQTGPNPAFRACYHQKNQKPIHREAFGKLTGGAAGPRLPEALGGPVVKSLQKRVEKLEKKRGRSN